MMKRRATRSPWKVEEFASTSGSGIVEIDAVFEVEPGSRSVSSAEAEATEAPSPPLVDVSTFITRSDVEQVDSRSRLEVEPISRGASPASLI